MTATLGRRDEVGGASLPRTVVRPDQARLRRVRAARLAADRRCPLATALVWKPASIGPVPEEMGLEESLLRRFRVAPPGLGVSGWRDEARHRRLQGLPVGRCLRCDVALPWGRKACEACEPDEPEDAVPGEPMPSVRAVSAGSNFGAIILAALVVLGVMGWMAVQAAEGPQGRQAPAQCTVLVKVGGTTRLHRC